MFKNLTVYRISPGWAGDLTVVEQALAKTPFLPCGPTQEKSLGWVSPRGRAHAPLVELFDGRMLLQVQSEQRVVPASVVKRRTEELADRIEEATGRRPGKKQTKDLKDQALQELLPMAFTKQGSTRIWLCPNEGFLLIDSGSQGWCDEVSSLLVEALPGLALHLLHTDMSPAVAMAHWLGTGEAPYQFSVDMECELKAADELKSVVRYARHPLDTDEVKQHIINGKMPTRLALTWRERVSFLLTEGLALRKLDFLDVVFEGVAMGSRADQDESFDANAAITIGEMLELLPDLLEALGGEQRFDGDTPAPTPSAGPSDAAVLASGDDSPPW